MKKHKTLHDRGYTRLFSNKTFVSRLFHGFVKETWVKDIDFKKLERVETSFVSKKFAKRESDILYRVKYKNREAYIYLLLEFQSTVDKYMALRMLRYVIEIYEMLLKEEKYKNKKLPPIFPLVLYNGVERWRAAENIKDLIEIGDLERYVPDFQYVKISENEFSRKTLLKINNIVSALFLIENLSDKEIEEHVATLSEIIAKETDNIAIKEFNRWVAYQFHHDRVDETLLEEIDRATSKREVKNMFAKTAQQLMTRKFREGEQKGIQKGMEKGIQKGMEKGMEKGELNLLLNLLKRKFKRHFTKELQEKALTLNTKQINRIVGKIFEINGIDELKKYL